jgi:hypothetical protein
MTRRTGDVLAFESRHFYSDTCFFQAGDILTMPLDGSRAKFLQMGRIGRKVVDLLESSIPINKMEVRTAQRTNVEPLGTRSSQTQLLTCIFGRVVEIEAVDKKYGFDDR